MNSLELESLLSNDRPTAFKSRKYPVRCRFCGCIFTNEIFALSHYVNKHH